MTDRITCNCAACGAKYRLPVEFQGRKAKCKKCGEAFTVPQQVAGATLEDSVLNWLADDIDAPEEQAETAAQPKVIRIPSSGKRSHGSGPIRMKDPDAAQQQAAERHA